MSKFIIPVDEIGEFEFYEPRAKLWGFIPRRPRKHTMPLVEHIDPALRTGLAVSVAGVSQETLDEERAQMIWEAQLMVLDHYVPGLSARLSNQQLVAIFGRWYAVSNTTVGESSASSAS